MTTDAPPLEPIKRRNGKTYRPRKITVGVWQDDNTWEWRAGVVVLGTHDVARARVLADDWIRSYFDMAAGEATVGWYRLAMRDNEYQWVNDNERGRAGVWFEATEASYD